MEKLIVPVKGMHCASCASIIKKTLEKVDGVNSCDVNVGTEKAKIEYDNSKLNLENLSKKLEPLGYSLDFSEDNFYIPKSEETVGSYNHLDLTKTKEHKLKELQDQKNKLKFLLPVTFFSFFIMIWEVSAKTLNFLPNYFLSMHVNNSIFFILATIILFWIGKPFLKAILIFFRHRAANMDSLIGIGTLTAYIYSAIIVLFPDFRMKLNLPEMTYFDVTIVVIGFITLGKYLEAKSKLKTGEAIEKLMNLQAITALVERDGKEIEISAEEVEISEVIIIKPGTKIPVDGEIIEGKSSVDESMVTGESIPIDKNIGDSVIGGTINKQGYLKISATKIGSETLLSQIIKLVETAQSSKAPIQKLADKISSIFVPVVFVIAVVTLLLWLVIGPQFLSFNQALSFGLLCFVGVLVIACPCALGLATPTAIIVGVGKGAQNGILVKNAESLEKLHKVNVIVVDKTGTLTKGKPEVTDIIAQDSLSEDEILTILGSLEKNSEHPLAMAILERVENLKLELKKVENFEIIEGKGLVGEIDGEKYYVGNLKLVEELNLEFNKKEIIDLTKQGKTPVILMDREKVLAVIAIADTLKESSIESIKSLHKLGIKVIMLTGDNKNTAEFIANQTGIDEVFAEVLPSEKAQKIQELQNQGFLVAMAGDGVNDAPALAKSDVGVAMGTGTDVAIESADITLLQGDISKIVQAIKLSKLTIQTVRQNLFWAFIYNVVGIPLAAGLFYPVFGWLLNPIFAGLAMALSSVSVVGNSLRLKTKKL